MNKARFTKEQAAKIRHQYFFEQKPNGKRWSVVDLTKEYKTCEGVIRDIIKQVGMYKPDPEVLKSIRLTASEAMALFVNQQPRLPHANQESYATTMTDGTMLRIRKTNERGADGSFFYQVDTVRRTYEQAKQEAAVRDKQDR